MIDLDKQTSSNRALLDERRLARRLASGQGDLIYAVTLLLIVLSILLHFIGRAHKTNA
jgi:hypothetical protein